MVDTAGPQQSCGSVDGARGRVPLSGGPETQSHKGGGKTGPGGRGAKSGALAGGTYREGGSNVTHRARLHLPLRSRPLQLQFREKELRAVALQ